MFIQPWHCISLMVASTHQQWDRPTDEPDAADWNPTEEVQGIQRQYSVRDEDAEGEEAAVREDIHAQGDYILTLSYFELYKPRSHGC